MVFDPNYQSKRLRPFQKVKTLTVKKRGKTKTYKIIRGNRIPYLPLSGFPIKKVVRLKYATEFQMNPLSNAIGKYLFRANSCYDPDFSGIGHQPVGFDEWMKIYSHCTVIGSKIKATFLNFGTTHLTPGYCGILLSDDGNTLGGTVTNVEHLMETRSGSKAPQIAGLVLGNTNSMTTCRNSFSARKFFGKKAIVGDSLYRHTDTTNPAELAFYELYFAPIAGGDPGNITVLVQMEFIAVLTEPNTLNQS